MGDFVGNFFSGLIELVELIVHHLVRSVGLPEDKVKKLEAAVWWILILIFVVGLLYLTVRYS